MIEYIGSFSKDDRLERILYEKFIEVSTHLIKDSYASADKECREKLMKIPFLDWLDAIKIICFNCPFE